MTEERKWLKVSSFDELAPGTVVRIVGCMGAYGACGRSHVFVLFNRIPSSSPEAKGYKCCDTVTIWSTDHSACHPKATCTIRVCHAIPEGRLFRLDVGDLTETREEREDESRTNRLAMASQLLRMRTSK